MADEDFKGSHDDSFDSASHFDDQAQADFRSSQHGPTNESRGTIRNGHAAMDDGAIHEPDWQMLFDSYNQSLAGISDDVFNINDLMNM